MTTSTTDQKISDSDRCRLVIRTTAINAGILAVSAAIVIFVYFRYSLPASIPRHDRAGNPADPESLESYLFSFLIVQVLIALVPVLGSLSRHLFGLLSADPTRELLSLVFGALVLIEAFVASLTIYRTLDLAIKAWMGAP